MKFLSLSIIVRVAGIAAAVLVPALVVAQQALPNFTAGNVLRATDLQQLTNALNDTRQQLNALRTSVAAASLTKDRLYSASNQAHINPSATASVTASCANANDIAIDCSCGGNVNGAGTSQLDTRSMLSGNAAGSTSSCSCTGEFLGTSTLANIFAIALCLRAQ